MTNKANKANELVNVLMIHKPDRYVIGYLSSFIQTIVTDPSLTDDQSKEFQNMIDWHIRKIEERE